MKKIIDKSSVVVFDDYFIDRIPETQKIGCRSLVDSIDRKEYDVAIGNTVDSFKVEWGRLRISMVKVMKKMQ